MKQLLFIDTENMTLEEKSYIYGLLLSDGAIHIINSDTYTGQVQLEVSKRDEDIIDKLCSIVPYSTKRERVRNTNFKDNYHCVSFNISRQYFIKNLIDFGFPVEDKTINARPPSVKYDRNAFWRGVLDGDGSLGLRYRSNGCIEPYLSLTTKSEQLKNAFCEYLNSITGRKYNPKRNKRDSVYNIGCGGHVACKILKDIYDNCTIYLDRKHNKYLECTEWEKENIKPKRNISGVIGVGIDRKNNKWIAYLTIDKKKTNLGYYTNKQDAIMARLMAEKKYFGNAAKQQYLFKQYGLEE